MGMDVYGRNPKQNKPMKEFPILAKYSLSLSFSFQPNCFQATLGMLILLPEVLLSITVL